MDSIANGRSIEDLARTIDGFEAGAAIRKELRLEVPSRENALHEGKRVRQPLGRILLLHLVIEVGRLPSPDGDEGI